MGVPGWPDFACCTASIARVWMAVPALSDLAWTLPFVIAAAVIEIILAIVRMVSQSRRETTPFKTCRSRKGSDFVRAATIRSGSSSSDISRSVSPSGSCRQATPHLAPRTHAPLQAREKSTEKGQTKDAATMAMPITNRSVVSIMIRIRTLKTFPLVPPRCPSSAACGGRPRIRPIARLSFGHDAGREMKKSQSAGCAEPANRDFSVATLGRQLNALQDSLSTATIPPS
jgi:hypothetical protein